MSSFNEGLKEVAFIALGSNIGDPPSNIKKAISLLREKGLSVIKESALYLTKPYGIEDQPDFVNAAVIVNTELSPKKLFSVLKDIEREMGRVKGLRYGPRVIDLDIIFYDNLIYQDAIITIPHPRLQERSFVLYPLCDLDCNLIHPLFKKSVLELKELLKDDLGIMRVKGE